MTEQAAAGAHRQTVPPAPLPVEEIALDAENPVGVPDQTEPEPPPKVVLELIIAKGGMAAYIRTEHVQPAQFLTVQEVLDFLEEKGITYGLCLENIQDFCENRRFYTDLTAARGKEPVREMDGTLDFLFRTEQTVLPHEDEHGVVDFRNLDLVQNVHPGDALCVITPPAGGEDGVNVKGEPVPFKPGFRPQLPSGENTRVSEDGLSLLSAVDGCVELRGKNVVVSTVFDVHDNVDASVGNINFVGTVRVAGDVCEGFKIEAGGDVVVKGLVEAASITAGGSISIGKGINGMGRGTLKATGDVICKFVENAVIEAGGDVKSEAIMNSRITAGNSVVLRGGKGTLTGGVTKVGKSICANAIGTPRYANTVLSIQAPRLNGLLLSGGKNEDLDRVQAEVNQENYRLEELKKEISSMTAQLSGGDEYARATLKKRVMKKGELMEHIHELTEKLEQMKQDDARLMDFKVIALKLLYPGVRISISSHNWIAEDTYNATKFYADSDGIVTSQVTPADKP